MSGDKGKNKANKRGDWHSSGGLKRFVCFQLGRNVDLVTHDSFERKIISDWFLATSSKAFCSLFTAH